MPTNVLGVISAMAGVALQPAHDQNVRPGMPVITLSRDFGSGGDIIAERLAQRLDVPLCDRSVLNEVSRRLKEDPAILQLMEKGAGTAKDLWLYRLFTGAPLGLDDHRKALAMVISGLSRSGGVIVGHGAHVILADTCALRVRIVGSAAVCARRMASEGHGEVCALETQAHDVNHSRAKFVWDLFKSRLADSSQFDIVINTDRMGDFEEVVEVLEGMARAIHEGRVLRASNRSQPAS